MSIEAKLFRIVELAKAGNRPVIISLVSQIIKKKFFSNFEVFKSKGLTIANDSTKEEREHYKKLKEIKVELIAIGIESQIIKTKILIENNMHNLEEALNYLEKKKIENNNNNNREKNEISGYESDTSSVVSSNSNTSRKREKKSTNIWKFGSYSISPMDT